MQHNNLAFYKPEEAAKDMDVLKVATNSNPNSLAGALQSSFSWNRDGSGLEAFTYSIH